MPIIQDSILDEAFFNKEREDLGLQFYFSSMASPEFHPRKFALVNHFNTSAEDIERRKNHYKSYPFAKKIMLPRNTINLDQVDLQKLLLNRAAHREFTGEPITIEQLASLLRYGNGLKAPLPTNDVPYELNNMLLRTAPSGGARFPIEVYIFIVNVEGVPSGIYHYNIREFSLELLLGSQEMGKVIKKLYGDPIDFEKSACLFTFTGVFYRNIEKYGLRGWRVLFLDAGHMGMLFWLISQALGLGGTSLAGGFDLQLSRVLGFNSHQEGILQSFVLGRIRK